MITGWRLCAPGMRVVGEVRIEGLILMVAITHVMQGIVFVFQIHFTFITYCT